MDRKKTVFSWAMFDFANSSYTTLIVTFIYSTYFTKVIASNEIAGTMLWSRGVTIAALSVALLSPFLGTIADKGGYRKRFLFISTATAILGSVMLYFPMPGQVFYALTWFIIGDIAFEMSMVFYNAFLPGITTSENIGRISGYGWGAGYIGGLAAMFIAMIGFVNPEVPWFGLSREMGQNIRATNILVAVWFCVFSIPMFLFVKEKYSGNRQDKKDGLHATVQELYTTFREIKKYRQILRFLIARLVYNDGLVTIFAFGGIYAAGTFDFTFQEIMTFGVVLNISAGLGALTMGFLDDAVGGKKTIQVSLIGLIIASLIAVFAPNKTLFWIAGIIVGIFSGPNQSASRSLMARFIPEQKQGEFFGFFAFSGKFTAFVGPFLLGVLTGLFNSQRVGISVVVFMFVIGGIILSTIDEEEGKMLANRDQAG